MATGNRGDSPTRPALVERHGSAARVRLAWAGLAISLVGIAGGLVASQAQADQQLDAVFQARADIARQFVSSYVNDIFGREEFVAREQLAGPAVSDAQLKTIAQSFGFTAAVLIDARGDALAVLPSAPAKLGTNLAAKYPHLRQAESGSPVLSHVVRWAAQGRPVVAFAVPYATPSGRRVFSGGFDVGSTPVADYLNNALPLVGAAVYLVDQQTGVVVADKMTATPNAAPLSAQAPELAAAASREADGSFTTPAGGQYFVQRDVADSPWRIVMSVPDATLYAPVEGASRWAPWAIFVALALGAVAFGRMLVRLQRSRAALAVANADLVLLARIDKLTGLYNRRHVEEQLDILLHATARDGSPLTVLMVDVDHFKDLNDAHGHLVGDRALQGISGAMRLVLRPGDVVGRWGGEEFLVLLPGADVEAAAAVAERLREAVEDARLVGGEAATVRLTVSVGIGHVERGDFAQAVIARADASLYRAKRAGRNTVAA